MEMEEFGMRWVTAKYMGCSKLFVFPAFFRNSFFIWLLSHHFKLLHLPSNCYTFEESNSLCVVCMIQSLMCRMHDTRVGSHLCLTNFLNITLLVTSVTTMAFCVHK